MLYCDSLRIRVSYSSLRCSRSIESESRLVPLTDIGSLLVVSSSGSSLAIGDTEKKFSIFDTVGALSSLLMIRSAVRGPVADGQAKRFW